MRALLLSAVLALASAEALAEGPGSRIGTPPQVPLEPQPVVVQLVKRCNVLHGEMRKRCLERARSAHPSRAMPSGPAATGMSSGRTGSMPAGDTAGTFGASSPR